MPMPMAEYLERRARQLAGEQGVFFPEHPAVADGGPDPVDTLEAFPVLPPRLRRGRAAS